MASTYIDIKAEGSRQAADTRYSIDKLQQVVNEFREIKATMDQMAAGSDFTTLGGYLGISATDAEAVYNLIGSVNGELGATFITQLLARCG